FSDWIYASTITLGMLANSLACIAIGAGRSVFQRSTHDDSDGFVNRNGILVAENDVIALKGSVKVVETVTHGTFLLRFPGEPECRYLKLCIALLLLLPIVQILLIPQGSLLGQICFVVSITVSWIYNTWLASWGTETRQREACIRNVLRIPVVWRYRFGTKTAAAVFTSLALDPQNPNRIVDAIITNDIPALGRFKDDIISRIR
ncbi:hypothetical protein V8B97DRAFT_1848631, partial [Scleroderma yunnanense]